MDIEINTFDGVVLKTKGKYVETDINLFVSDKAFEEILYDGEVENGTLGANKLASLVDKTITEVTAEDLKGATKIGNYAFYNNTLLTSLKIPNTVTEIRPYSVQNCRRLKEITIPNSITFIGQNAFASCTSLTSITIPNSVTSIETGIFQSCGLTSVIFEGPCQLTTIKSYMFDNCTSLGDITIPSSVTSISDYALQIGTSTNKATITFLGTTPPSIYSNTFNASYLNKIIVPKGYGEVYKSATNWSNFADYIVEATE